MTHHVTLIAGDGIGPEVAKSMTQVIEAAGVKIAWDHQSAGLDAVREKGLALPEATLNSIRKNQVAIKGPTTTPVGTGHKSANVILRQELDLYACIRPVKSVPGIPTRFENVDLVIFRENTEGLYAGKEIEIEKGYIISLKISTTKANTRIAKSAFEYAEKYDRKKVSIIHKANILKMGDGLFLHCGEDVAAAHPKIASDNVIVDALCMQLVTNPTRFDVLLLENLYGDIVSDLCAGLVGGLGLVPGANIGERYAVFEAVHGSAPDIAGKNLANPTAMLKSAVMMLDHLGERNAAKAIEDAIHHVFLQGKVRTKDLGGTSSTNELTEAIISAL